MLHVRLPGSYPKVVLIAPKHPILLFGSPHLLSWHFFFVLLFVPPKTRLSPGSLSRHFSPLPTTIRAFDFIARNTSALVCPRRFAPIPSVCFRCRNQHVWHCMVRNPLTAFARYIPASKFVPTELASLQGEASARTPEVQDFDGWTSVSCQDHAHTFKRKECYVLIIL